MKTTECTVTRWKHPGLPTLILEGTPEQSRTDALACFGEDEDGFALAVPELATMDRAEFLNLGEWEP